MSQQRKSTRRRTKSWRRRLKENKRFQDNERLFKANLQVLERDKAFLIEREKVWKGLQTALSDGKKSKCLLLFFSKFGHLPLNRTRNAAEWLDLSANREVCQLLKDYIEFRIRFGVVFDIKKDGKSLDQVILAPAGRRFHLQLKDGKLKPFRRVSENEHDIDFYESDDVSVPVEIRNLIESGEAKFVQIEDDGHPSPLSLLEEVTLNPATITFILHATPFPNLLLFVGEQVDAALWRKAGKAVSAFQRKYQGREHAGRPRDLSKLTAAHQALREPGPQKEKAIALAPLANAEGQQVYLSKRKKEISGK